MTSTGRELATLGGGCFWCLEAVFESVRGVESVKSGYAGGHKSQILPTRRSARAAPGHAEVVQVAFDPSRRLLPSSSWRSSSRSTIRRL